MREPNHLVEQLAFLGYVAVTQEQELICTIADTPELRQATQAICQGFYNNVSPAVAVDLVDEAESVNINEGNGADSPFPMQLLGGVSVGEVG